MRLTWKDAVTTLSTAAVVAVYIAYLQGANLPLISSARGTTVAVLILGLVGGCAFGDAGEVCADTAPRSTRILAVISSALGFTAFAAGLLGLVTGAETALAILFAATVALWLIATMRHTFTGPARPSVLIDSRKR